MAESYEKLDRLPIDDESDVLATRLKTQLLHCSGFDGDEISNERQEAADYYFQRVRGDEVEGRSHYVSGDVAAMVDATVAQMMEAFSSDRICDFDPLDADDEDQAQLESEAVQYFVMGRENGFLQLTMAIKEALLFRNGLITVDAVDLTERESRRLGNVSPDALPALLDDDDIVRSDYDQESGELVITRKTTRREFVMQSQSMENFVYHSEWHQPTLSGIPICAIRHIDKRADLIKLGFDKKKVDALTQYRHPLKPETMARNPRSKKYTTTALDHSQQLVEWYEIYTYMDAGDGSDELRRVDLHHVDTVILRNRPASRVRAAVGTCILNPHRFTGISLYDKLKQSQDNRTALRRALHDNVNAVNRSRTAGLEGVVIEDDITDGRVNNHIRVKNNVPDVRAALMSLAIQDSSANILANLESSARERTEMGGAALDLQSANMQIGGDRMGSQGLDRAYSVAEQLSAAMMKTIAATLIRDVFLLAHATLREFFDDPLPIKRNGKWEMIEPSKWPERRSVTVKPGMSPGERTRRAQALGDTIDAQLSILQRDPGMEGVLVDLPGFNRALMDWSRMREVQNPEQYWVDPESPDAQAKLKQNSEQAQRADMERKGLMQNAVNLEQLRIALSKYEGDSDRIVEVFKILLQTEVEEAKLVGGATKDIIAQVMPGVNGSGQETAGGGSQTQQAADGNTDGTGS